MKSSEAGGEDPEPVLLPDKVLFMIFILFITLSGRVSVDESVVNGWNCSKIGHRTPTQVPGCCQASLICSAPCDLQRENSQPTTHHHSLTSTSVPRHLFQVCCFSPGPKAQLRGEQQGLGSLRLGDSENACVEACVLGMQRVLRLCDSSESTCVCSPCSSPKAIGADTKIFFIGIIFFKCCRFPWREGKSLSVEAPLLLPSGWSQQLTAPWTGMDAVGIQEQAAGAGKRGLETCVL